MIVKECVGLHIICSWMIRLTSSAKGFFVFQFVEFTVNKNKGKAVQDR